jgi:hypothetical protein
MPVYYMLCTLEEDGKWSPQWGDYSYAAVLVERQEAYQAYAMKDKKIVKCEGDTQADVDRAVARLNQG